MSVNELQDEVSSKCGSVSTSADGRELKLARIRIQQLELQLTLKDKVEQCRIEYEEDSPTSPVKSHCCATEQGCNKRLDVESYVNSLPDRAPSAKPMNPALRLRSEHHRESGSISEFGNLLSICMGFPKKELKKFTGNPMDYWGFIRSFMSSVDSYTDDFANRLSYLIQYCDGEALDSIKGCTVLEPELGYNEAISILHRCFGQPYFIARCYIRSLTEGCILKQDDAKGLTDLTEKMKTCATTLRQLHYESDMNSCRKLGDIVRRLPTPMQSKWFEIAATILRHGREPSFTDLTRFVDEKADAANMGLHYMIPGSSNSYSQPSIRTATTQPEPGKHRIYNVNAHVPDRISRIHMNAPKLQCAKCEAAHYTDQCPDFVSLTVDGR
ncbi:hypothetical protein EG68_12523 [Paragonimus skrjabini miyazakii]|uniref:Gag protein n=1 Tax=Paragonimus skrjabini miyazakii TaxID=59628 RepID=A0A8S9YHH4_9TREM|nr:hypothetical protein EG68_12523 [Paragonimus skrjabini miyazakii]